MQELILPAAVTLANLVLLFACAGYVGKTRVQCKIDAPATSGHPMLERAFRIHMNTLENTVLFLPALWLAALYFSPRVAAALGAVWIAARIWYAFAYASDPGKRGGGFGLATLAWGGLVVVASWGMLRTWFAG